MMGSWWSAHDAERSATARVRRSPHDVAHFPDDPPPRWHQPVLALGNFDGLHRGHMKIIDRVRRRAGERAGTPAAMTFDPHPPRVLRPDKAPPLLMTTEQKLEALARAGMQGVAVVRFTRELSLLGSRDVRPHRARRVAARRRGLGRRQLPVRARARRHVQRCCAASARATGSAPRRSIPSATRTSSSAARGSGGWCRKGASTKPARCSAITTSSTASVARGAGRGRELGFPDRQPRHRQRAAAAGRASTRPRVAIDGVVLSVDHQHRPAADVRRRRPPDGRDAHLRPRSRPLRPDAAAVVRPAAAGRAGVPRRRRAARADRGRLPQRAAAVRPHFAVESAYVRIERDAGRVDAGPAHLRSRRGRVSRDRDGAGREGRGVPRATRTRTAARRTRSTALDDRRRRARCDGSAGDAEPDEDVTFEFRAGRRRASC